MKFDLPDLKYNLGALEPYFSKETLDYHYNKHHQGYVRKLNEAIQGNKFQDLPLNDIIVQSREERNAQVFNNATQHWNHSFFWNCIGADTASKPSGELARQIEKDFGSLQRLQDSFSEKATSVFGSGWAWLVKNEDGRLEVQTTQNSENFIGMNRAALLTCDMWEHAYYIDYRNDKKKYMDAFWEIVAWDHASGHFGQEV